jgi:hypothetical protein
MHPFTEVIGPPREMRSDASRVGIAASDQARPAIGRCWLIEGRKREHHTRAHQPLRERLLRADALSKYPRGALYSNGNRHLAAGATSLGWTRKFATRGDHADAFGSVWLIEAISNPVSHEYEAKRQAVLTAWLRSRRGR